MNVSTARAIITQALEDETYEGEMPEDDEKAIEEAEGLLQMATDAWSQDIKGPEVEAIIKLAEADEDEDGSKPAPKAKAKPAPKAKAAPKAKPAPKKKAEPEPEPADERASNEPWDDYDSTKVDEVIEGIEVWAEDDGWDDVEHVYIYEQAHKNRKRIIDRIEELHPELPRDEVPAGGDDSEPESEEPEEPRAIEEPFDGYADLKIGDVIDALDDYLGNDEVSDEDKLETLAKTHAFESVNKTRVRLMDYLDAKKAGIVGEEVDGEPEAPAEEPKPKAKASAKSNGATGFTLTREQVLAALTDGSVEVGG